jgi:simple sugar transport system permease protein
MPSGQTLPVLVTFVLFVALFSAGSLRYESFFSAQVLLNLLVDNAFLIVLAVGMTFVVLTGGIDLSVGSVVALSGVLAARLLAAGWPPVPVMAVVLLVGLGLGTAMGLVIHHLELQPFVVTLAGMFLARGMCFVISVQSIPIRDPLFTDIASAAITLPGDTFVSPSALLAVAVVAVAAYVLHATRFGRSVYAVGGNEHSAMLMGLPVARTKVAVYAISGTCSPWPGCCSASTRCRATASPPSARSSTPSPPPSSAGRCSPAASGWWWGRCSACWCWASSRPSSPSRARSAPGGPVS